LAQLWYRAIGDSQDRWPNPFETGPDSYFELLNSPSEESLPDSPLSRFMVHHLKTQGKGGTERLRLSIRARLLIAAQVLLGNNTYNNLRTIYRWLVDR
jgi:hypothetical protein